MTIITSCFACFIVSYFFQISSTRLKINIRVEEDTLYQAGLRKLMILVGAFLGVWIFIRFLFPFFMPFLLGLLLARWADPMVGFLEKKIHLPRSAAAGIAITAGFALVFALLALPGSLLLRQLSHLPRILPQIQQTISDALAQLELWLLELAEKLPGELGGLLMQSTTQLFSSGTTIMGRAAEKLPGLATGMLGHLADGAAQFGTALLASFLISVRLPRIRQWLTGHLPRRWQQQYLPMLAALRRCFAGWLQAQVKLALVAAGILSVSFLFLNIPAALLWAAVIALVDAVPMLGTGTVLVPWSLISLMQGNQLQFFGLLATYCITAVSRSVLEPKLLGKSMGLDPLLMLAAVYVGFRLWGLIGMVLLPLAVSSAVQLSRLNNNRNC